MGILGLLYLSAKKVQTRKTKILLYKKLAQGCEDVWITGSFATLCLER